MLSVRDLAVVTFRDSKAGRSRSQKAAGSAAPEAGPERGLRVEEARVRPQAGIRLFRFCE